MFKQSFILIILSALLCGRAIAQADSTLRLQDSVVNPNKKSGLVTPVKKLVSSAFNRYFNDQTAPQDSKLLLYPTIAFSPETSWEIGVSALFLYYANRDTLNRLSEIQGLGFITFNQQYGAWLDHFIYTDKDEWFFLGKIRLQRFPLLYFGVGANARKEDKQLVNSSYILIRERVLRKIKPNLFAGLEFDYQHLYNVSIDSFSSRLPKPNGGRGTRNIGIGAGLVYDNRHNALNVRQGFFAEAAYLHYAPATGSDFSFRSISIDTRLFRTVRKNQVFAAQVYGQFIGGNPPFNQLAMVGGEGLGRGYYMGRYRDRNYMAAQVEYRFLPFNFSKRFGAAIFAATGSVAPTIRQFGINQLLPSGGAGVRFLVFPKKDIFLRFDVGFSKEGPAFYIYSGEAF